MEGSLFKNAFNTLFTFKEMFYLRRHSTHFSYGYMEGRKEMFYLRTQSTHFSYGYMEGRNEMALNTF